MAHDLLKIFVTLIVLALVVAVMALFVSGYLSAFKPGDKSKQGPASAVSSGRSSYRALPSPSPGVNQSMQAYQQQAMYAPPGPVMPPAATGMAQAPPTMPAGMGMQPPVVSQKPPTAAAPSFRMPQVPSAPGLDSIIDILFRVLPLIFHHDFDLSPVWPHPTR
jgi:hypothetical protein